MKRLTIEDSILITVDVQEKLLPVISGKEELLDKTVRMILGAKELGVPRLYTQQYTKGIGPSVPEVIAAEVGEDGNGESGANVFKYTDKKSFSILGEKDFVDQLPTVSTKKSILLQGIEAHICVLQSAFDLIEDGYDVYILADAVSSRNPIDTKYALKRLRQAGAILTTVEAALFELTGGAGNEHFKAISKIIK
ncbi:MAG: isochorismatase family protein [Clostridiales Family XIII bacterium]|jgi:nicotinamidase-related amidase|nr:isochorismatase family protein [Clostridiales Family XIII bacterium]